MHNRVIALALTAAAIAVGACGGSDDTTTPPPPSKILNFTATLTPSGELGATLAGNPTGSGTFTATLDTSTNVFSYNMTVSGLTSNINNAHIHGPFVPGGTATTAGVLLNFSPNTTTAANGVPNATFTGFGSATSGTATGSVTLTPTLALTSAINGDSLKKLILNGAAYVNVHTASNGGGEVRGQIQRKP